MLRDLAVVQAVGDQGDHPHLRPAQVGKGSTRERGRRAGGVTGVSVPRRRTAATRATVSIRENPLSPACTPTTVRWRATESMVGRTQPSAPADTASMKESADPIGAMTTARRARPSSTPRTRAARGAAGSWRTSATSALKSDRAGRSKPAMRILRSSAAAVGGGPTTSTVGRSVAVKVVSPRTKRTAQTAGRSRVDVSASSAHSECNLNKREIVNNHPNGLTIGEHLGGKRQMVMIDDRRGKAVTP